MNNRQMYWSWALRFVRSDRGVYALFAILALLTFWDTLFGQYIFRLDMVFSPVTHFNIENLRDGIGVVSSVFYNAILWALNLILPAFLVQKIILVGTFISMQIGMFRATRSHGVLSASLAGVMYAFNPFVYDRLLAGHWLFLIGYALLPFVFMAARDYFQRSETKVWKLVAILSFSNTISVHFFVLNSLLVIATWAMYSPAISRTNAYRLARSLLLITLANSWWIVPLVISSTPTRVIGSPPAFQTQPDPNLGLVFNVATLHGFWHNSWPLLKDTLAWWPVIMTLWLTPVAIGLGALYRENRRRTLALLALGVCAFILSLGSAPGVYQINNWLHATVPGFSGFREPQKFLALTTFVYAFATARGLSVVFTRQKEFAAIIVTVVVLVMSPFLFAARGELHAVRYSGGWDELRTVLNEEVDPKVLVLPWDQYLEGTFTGTLTASPALANYGDVIVQNQNPRLDGVPDNTPTRYLPITQAVSRQNQEELLEALEQLHITHILVIKSTSFERYRWFLPEEAGTIIIDDAQIVVVDLTSN